MNFDDWYNTHDYSKNDSWTIDMREAFEAGRKSSEQLERIALAADGLVEVTEACLRMMDDALKGTGVGDMAIKPDSSLTLFDGWKRLAAYREATK